MPINPKIPSELLTALAVLAVLSQPPKGMDGCPYETALRNAVKAIDARLDGHGAVQPAESFLRGIRDEMQTALDADPFAELLRGQPSRRPPPETVDERTAMLRLYNRIIASSTPEQGTRLNVAYAIARHLGLDCPQAKVIVYDERDYTNSDPNIDLGDRYGIDWQYATPRGGAMDVWVSAKVNTPAGGEAFADTFKSPFPEPSPVDAQQTVGHDSTKETHEAEANVSREALSRANGAGVVTGGGSRCPEDKDAVNRVAGDLACLMQPHIDRLAGNLPKGTFLHLTVGRAS